MIAVVSRLAQYFTQFPWMEKMESCIKEYIYIDIYAVDMSLLACEANGVQRNEKVWVYKAAYLGVEEQRVNAPRERL